MKRNILITMGMLIVFGFAFQGFFGVAAGILIASLVGLGYGWVKKERFFIRWSLLALFLDLLCMIGFYGIYNIGQPAIDKPLPFNTIVSNPLKQKNMKHAMPQLPYELEALAPLMSKETLDFHYGKHLQAYVDNLNRLIEGTPWESLSLEEIIQKSDGGVFNNAAQAWNHTFFFQTLTPEQGEMPENLKAKLTESFGSPEEFVQQFTKAAATFFGSGWVWLVADDKQQLSIVAESNAGNPLRDGLKPILVIDVWEHAYYIDYRNRRAEYIDAFWKLVDWKKVAERI